MSPYDCKATISMRKNICDISADIFLFIFVCCLIKNLQLLELYNQSKDSNIPNSGKYYSKTTAFNMKHTRKKIFALLCFLCVQNIAIYADEKDINDKYIDDVVKEYPQSVLSFQKKMAENGNLSAQKTLGQLFMSGKEVSVDLNESKRWFTMAANAGDSDSINQLMLIDIKLNGFSRDAHSEWYLKLQNDSSPSESTSTILKSVETLKEGDV